MALTPKTTFRFDMALKWKQGGGNTPPLDTTDSTSLVKPEVNLDDFIKIIDEYEKMATALVVTDITHTAEMKLAKAGWSFVREKRIALTNKCKTVLEPHKAFIKEVNGKVNKIVERMKETEAILKEKKDFKERWKTEQFAIRRQDRIAKLAECNVNVGMYDIDNMSDDLFEKCLEKERIAWEARKANPPQPTTPVNTGHSTPPPPPLDDIDKQEELSDRAKVQGFIRELQQDLNYPQLTKPNQHIMETAYEQIKGIVGVLRGELNKLK
jgi:hypothetical protein